MGYHPIWQHNLTAAAAALSSWSNFFLIWNFAEVPPLGWSVWEDRGPKRQRNLDTQINLPFYITIAPFIHMKPGDQMPKFVFSKIINVSLYLVSSLLLKVINLKQSLGFISFYLVYFVFNLDKDFNLCMTFPEVAPTHIYHFEWNLVENIASCHTHRELLLKNSSFYKIPVTIDTLIAHS